MVQRRNALGRGLDALLSMDEVQTEGSSSINEIELSKISVNPNQPRREFDETALGELADSISEIGIIQPITLRKINEDEYQIIAGERRYRASLKAGLKSIPAYIRTADDENVMEMALIENIQREDLNSVEIALAYQHLIEQYDLTQERLSERVGKKRTTIANYLRLLKLNPTLEIEGFLLTMYDSRLRQANQIYDEVKKHFQELVFKTVIQRNVKLSEAPSYGLPTILYDAESTGAKNHLSLAKELISKNKNK